MSNLSLQTVESTIADNLRYGKNGFTPKVGVDACLVDTNDRIRGITVQTDRTIFFKGDLPRWLSNLLKEYDLVKFSNSSIQLDPTRWSGTTLTSLKKEDPFHRDLWGTGNGKVTSQNIAVLYKAPKVARKTPTYFALEGSVRKSIAEIISSGSLDKDTKAILTKYGASDYHFVLARFEDDPSRKLLDLGANWTKRIFDGIPIEQKIEVNWNTEGTALFYNNGLQSPILHGRPLPIDNETFQSLKSVQRDQPAFPNIFSRLFFV